MSQEVSEVMNAEEQAAEKTISPYCLALDRGSMANTGSSVLGD